MSSHFSLSDKPEVSFPVGIFLQHPLRYRATAFISPSRAASPAIPQIRRSSQSVKSRPEPALDAVCGAFSVPWMMTLTKAVLDSDGEPASWTMAVKLISVPSVKSARLSV